MQLKAYDEGRLRCNSDDSWSDLTRQEIHSVNTSCSQVQQEWNVSGIQKCLNEWINMQ